MGRVLAFLYGVVCYVIFFLAFLYLVGFLSNLVVPNANTTAIDFSGLSLTTNSVDIDLNGHSILGVTVCGGPP